MGITTGEVNIRRSAGPFPFEEFGLFSASADFPVVTSKGIIGDWADIPSLDPYQNYKPTVDSPILRPGGQMFNRYTIGSWVFERPPNAVLAKLGGFTSRIEKPMTKEFLDLFM
jgi:hypothetical protein